MSRRVYYWCPHCGRVFTEEKIDEHVKVCYRTPDRGREKPLTVNLEGYD